MGLLKKAQERSFASEDYGTYSREYGTYSLLASRLKAKRGF